MKAGDFVTSLYRANMWEIGVILKEPYVKNHIICVDVYFTGIGQILEGKTEAMFRILKTLEEEIQEYYG